MKGDMPPTREMRCENCGKCQTFSVDNITDGKTTWTCGRCSTGEAQGQPRRWSLVVLVLLLVFALSAFGAVPMPPPRPVPKIVPSRYGALDRYKLMAKFIPPIPPRTNSYYTNGVFIVWPYVYNTAPERTTFYFFDAFTGQLIGTNRTPEFVQRISNAPMQIIYCAVGDSDMKYLSNGRLKP